ncbi:MAG: cell division protein SepF [Candidatus Coprovivens sp.]
MAIINFAGIFKNDEDQDIEEVIESEEEFYNPTSSTKKSKEVASSKMILLEPRAYSESQQIADHLKNRNSVVVNLKRVTSDQAKRIIDFLSGCVYAIGGTMQNIGVGIYLCAPKNVNVQGKISEDNKKEQDGVDGEINW